MHVNGSGAATVAVEPPVAAGAAGNTAMRIGSALERVRRELFVVGDALAESLEAAGVALTREALQLLGQQTCRIAVVGQIKAGKSSVVNALVQQPSLLPTDVNPATSAVTHLHFNQRSPTGHEAVFRFFRAGEWERLAEGGGRLRELTQRLVPGFEPALLRHTINAVVQRASARLGPRFSELLGTTHAYERVSRDVLVKYVCAGDAAQSGEIGLYSDITQSADLYLETGPFDFPVTLVDTPGTNDPFLMRDEITRGCLEGADAYVVVLTAHQPLSDSDVSLLRILRGLDKQRIVVFVNRIDELADVEREAAEVVAFVRKRLALEFPGSSIPVIAGSARWGAWGLAAGTDVAGNAGAPRDPAAWKRSGLPEMRAALDRLLATSHCAYVMRQIAHCFAEMARACDAATRHELDGARRIHQQALVTAERAQAELAKVDVETKRLAETRKVIEASATQFDQQLRAMLLEDTTALKSRLIGIVDAQAREERDALVGALHSGRAPKVWTCDAGSLRRELSAGFLDGFARSQARLADLSSKVSAGLRRLSEALVPGSSSPPEPGAGEGFAPPPSPTPLSGQLAIDLEAGWWAQLRAVRPTPDERGAAVEALVRGEFYPVVEELTASYSRALEDYVQTTTRWSFGVCQSIVEALTRRQEQLGQHYAAVRQGIDTAADPQVIGQQAAHIVGLERRLKACQDAGHRLKGVSRSLEGGLAGAGGGI